MTSENAFHISILASGSTGNSLFIETKKKKILVDVGLSGKKITNLLAEIGRKPEELDAIFVTHEHRDHIHGLGVMARKYQLDIYANEKTWEAMNPLIGIIPTEQKQLFEMGKVMTFGDMDIESFGVSHDAIAPQFYCFHKENHSFVMLTDTGYCSDHIRGLIRNADAYLMETNHEVEMLRAGPYPWHLKQRILSDKGHLSNEEGALVMADVIGDKTKQIYLGHLSKKNNTKFNARLTMESILKTKDLGVNEDFKIYDTDPEHPTELFTL
ncbi:MBL fold metallo-hydrolase [Melissococcus plutonius]|uniref:Zn-dependent hydrolase (Beta-lactamase superfamily) n=2 Tax=Melissococcus plutonius TaxID=33970 RepID=F3YB74_MELPT|nr:MBL fold metallo-hydrolase [Melissococcus plutonius]BAL61900.1 Zn-dependent hydrolase [Melissococcus plutonius DAT561]AIM25168.1 Zn-dependent hydrolase [Melissococcus plutonius S1]KMT25427.1 Zn-dependent hydrolase [Melissococcus plutonius]KMT25467.1 Zn-dependent hydrolase [Melissococcus plutonius]KMT26331.1 Zn-dependent hydrolase [Melissococcus plutonius]